MENNAYQAYANGANNVAETPRKAALKFFAENPNRRKCNVIQGRDDGAFFTVAYDRDNWPKSWKDVTKKTAMELPDE